MKKEQPGKDQRYCKECKQWLHHSRFRSWKREGRFSTESPIRFSEICKSCEQKVRNEKKNEDRPLAIIKQRARAAATKWNRPFEFFWTDMNYKGLVDRFRLELQLRCLSCDHEYLNERDVQIEHREAPRGPDDVERLHARNIGFICGSCNRTKGKKSYSDWLREQEEARLSNLKDQDTAAGVIPTGLEPIPTVTGPLFGNA